MQELKAPSHGKVRERCMPGTREDVLTLIKSWLDDLNGPNIFWLSGSPGSGKTTIASTVVADFHCFSGNSFSVMMRLSFEIQTTYGGILLWTFV